MQTDHYHNFITNNMQEAQKQKQTKRKNIKKTKIKQKQFNKTKNAKKNRIRRGKSRHQYYKYLDQQYQKNKIKYSSQRKLNIEQSLQDKYNIGNNSQQSFKQTKEFESNLLLRKKNCHFCENQACKDKKCVPISQFQHQSNYNCRMLQTSTPSKFQQSNSKQLYQKASSANLNLAALRSQKIELNLMKSNIERQMHVAKFFKLKVLCPKFFSIRDEYLAYVRERSRVLRLSRQACQLVIYYMDEYFSKKQYIQQQALLIFSIFFIIASKVVQQHALPMAKIATEIEQSYQQLCQMEIKVMKTLNFRATPTTYIPILNSLLMDISQCSEVSINFFQNKQQNYVLIRRIYLACEMLYDQLDTIDIKSIKIIVRKALKSFLPQQEFLIVKNRIIGQTFEEQHVICAINQAYEETLKKQQKIKQDYRKNTYYKNYGIFVNSQR